jgi:hypothetical protein
MMYLFIDGSKEHPVRDAIIDTFIYFSSLILKILLILSKKVILSKNSIGLRFFVYVCGSILN